FLFSYPLLYAQDRILFSPGVKFGYAFGKGGGYIYGFEISFMFDPDISNPHNRYGAVVSYEIIGNENRLHLGAQVNFSKYERIWEIVGIEVGPTFIFEDNIKQYGISVTPYFGAFIIPYYRLLYVPNEFFQHEVGSFVKLHTVIQGGYKF
ncbi:MAG: hypothetical protein MUO60_20890, partial [Clostridiaceae bacterium]|nr:hypothetical protein [Clostridiaceae bacterium]